MAGLLYKAEYGHLEGWTNGKHPLVASVGTEMILSLDPCFELLENNRTKSGIIATLPSLKEVDWLKYAANHHVLRIELTTTIGFTFEEACFVDWLITFTSWTARADRQVVIEFCQREEVREFVSEMARTANESAEKNQEYNWPKLPPVGPIHPAIIYYFQVEMPLFLRHGEWTTTLLRRATYAKSPDFKALDRLVRADRRFRRHPKLIAAMRRMTASDRRKSHDVIKKSINLKPQKIGMKRLKILSAGLLAKIAESLRVKLQGPDIRALFDLQSPEINCIRKDHDLPGSPEGLQKQVCRAKKAWSKAIPG